MRKDRLLKLADYLETVPRSRFDMRSFDDEEREGFSYNECGFAGCALGWAAAAKLFRGLSWKITKPDHMRHIEYRGDIYFSAAEKLFSISHEDVFSLFGDQNAGQTPKQVAKRIRKFVAESTPQSKSEPA